jgi:hypothetical protein
MTTETVPPEGARRSVYGRQAWMADIGQGA